MRVKITKRHVDAIRPGDRDRFLWDNELKGFGLKVTSTGRKIYILQYRMGGRGLPVRRYTIGNHGDYTPDRARAEAEKLRGSIRSNVDPGAAKRMAREEQRTAPTVKQLCQRYLENPPPKKASTLAVDKGRITRHIEPLLGSRLVRDVTPGDIRRFMVAVATGKTKADVKTGKHGRAIVEGGEGAATRTVGLLGGIFAYAVAEGYRTDNPVRGVKRYPDRKAERFLSSAELRALGDVLSAAEQAWDAYNLKAAAWRENSKQGPRPERQEGAEHPIAIIAIRLLLFTGCRKSEILTLKWDQVDFERSCLRFSESKTGPKVIPLGAPALVLLNELERTQGNPYVLGTHSQTRNAYECSAT
jgi:integrase